MGELILFAVLVGMGFLFLRGRTAIKKTKVLPWTSVRLGGLVILAAGWLSGLGWGATVRGWIEGFLGAITGAFGQPDLGPSLVWLAGAVFLVCWIGGMLPDFAWDFDPPDEFLWFGIAAAWFVAHVPGRVGVLARGLCEVVGETVTHLVAGWF